MPEKQRVALIVLHGLASHVKFFFERFNKYKNSNHYFYEMDYSEYFSKVHKDPIGFYVYDGPYGYDAQLRGLRTAELFFSQNCVIIIDDTIGTSRTQLQGILFLKVPMNIESSLIELPAVIAIPPYGRGL